MGKYVTTFVNPPIPVRDYDWPACSEDYEPGDPIGWGETEAQALGELAMEMGARE